MPEAPTPRRRDRDFKTAHRHTRVVEILRSDVERRAYELFIARGREHGRDIEDWLTAEREFTMPGSTRRLGARELAGPDSTKGSPGLTQ
jgi:hypothetical protein